MVDILMIDDDHGWWSWRIYNWHWPGDGESSEGKAWTTHFLCKAFEPVWRCWGQLCDISSCTNIPDIASSQIDKGLHSRSRTSKRDPAGIDDHVLWRILEGMLGYKDGNGMVTGRQTRALESIESASKPLFVPKLSNRATKKVSKLCADWGVWRLLLGTPFWAFAFRLLAFIGFHHCST